FIKLFTVLMSPPIVLLAFVRAQWLTSDQGSPLSQKTCGSAAIGSANLSCSQRTVPSSTTSRIGATWMCSILAITLSSPHHPNEQFAQACFPLLRWHVIDAPEVSEEHFIVTEGLPRRI